jgi:uncharacterized membrane protein
VFGACEEEGGERAGALFFESQPALPASTLLFFTHTKNSAVLLPIYVSLAISYWLLSAVDKVVAPVYDALLGTHVFGLGAVTACGIVLGTGVLASSWIGSAALGLGEWVLRRLPLVSHVYSAAKQVSLALDPRGGESGDGGSSSGPFRECVLFANPRFGGALMLGFVTGSTTLKQAAPGAGEDVPLLSIFAPTNHAYVGDTFLLPAANVTRTTLSVRDGLEALVSCGMGLPRSITAVGGGEGLVMRETGGVGM